MRSCELGDMEKDALLGALLAGLPAPRSPARARRSRPARRACSSPRSSRARAPPPARAPAARAARPASAAARASGRRVTLSYSSVNGAPHSARSRGCGARRSTRPTTAPPVLPRRARRQRAARVDADRDANGRCRSPSASRSCACSVGGSPSGFAPYETDDFVRVDMEKGSLKYAYSMLWGRVGPVVKAGLEPVFVWENVPWGFVENNTPRRACTAACAGRPTRARLALYPSSRARRGRARRPLRPRPGRA